MIARELRPLRLKNRVVAVVAAQRFAGPVCSGSIGVNRGAGGALVRRSNRRQAPDNYDRA
jgi:hypothetical protein